MPRSSAIVRRVDEVDRLLGVAGEDPDQDGDAEQAGVVLGDPAAELGLDPVDGAVAEALGEAAELLAERHERRQRLHLLGPDGGDVDRVGDHAAGQRARVTCSAVIDAGAVLGLGGRGAEVRGDDDVVALEERVLGERLRGEDVERGAGRPCPTRAPRCERVEVDQLAAGAVDDPHAVLHLRDRLGVDPVRSVSGVFGRWRVMKSARP